MFCIDGFVWLTAFMGRKVDSRKHNFVFYGKRATFTLATLFSLFFYFLIFLSHLVFCFHFGLSYHFHFSLFLKPQPTCTMTVKCDSSVYHIHHIYINCWFPLYRWSVMEKQVTSTPPPPPPPPYLEMGGGGVLVTCIYITDHLYTGNQQLM